MRIPDIGAGLAKQKFGVKIRPVHWTRNHCATAEDAVATDAPGFYRVYAENDKAGSIAVNVDNRESNLEALTIDQIRELSKIARTQFFASSGKDVSNLRRLREGVPLWHYLLVGAMCLLTLEEIVAATWKR